MKALTAAEHILCARRLGFVNGKTDTAYAADQTGPFKMLASGGDHNVCGIKTDDTLQCWGYQDARTQPPSTTFRTS